MKPASHPGPPPLPIKSVHAEFQYTESEALRSTFAVTKESTRFARYVPWVGGVMILFWAIQTAKQGIHSTETLPLLFGLFMASMPLFVLHEAKKRFRKSPAAGATISWVFSEDKIENRTTGAQSSFEWNQLVLIKQVEYGFLLYPQSRIAHWIPKHAFHSKEDGTAFMQLIKNSGVKYQKS